MEGKGTLVEKEKDQEKEIVIEKQAKNEELKKEGNKTKKTPKEEIKKDNKDKSKKPKSEIKEKEIEKPKEKDTEFKKVEQVKQKEKKEFDTKETKNKRIKKGAIIAGVIIILAIFFSTIFSLVNINNTNILKGVSIKGIDVSGLSKEAAKEKMDKIYNDKLAKEIEVKYQEYETTIAPTVLETKYNIEKAVNEAYEIGKKDNIFVNNYKIVKTFLLKNNIDVDMSLNEDIIKQTIEDIGSKLPGIVVESSYYIEGNNLIIGKGKEGIKVDTDKLSNQIKENLNKIEINQNFIEIPVSNEKPDPINLEQIHEEVYTEVKDASYTKDPFEIHPEEEGIDFDIEQAKQILAAENKEEYIIPLKITKPKITIDQIGTEAFPNQVATFTTKYDASNSDRTTNLKLACQKLNGKVILSGETFSYNKTLGERTVAAGYRNGKIYENGEVVDGIGGGICQISSTLYNTVLMANLEIVERRNHQFVTSYLPAGRDATVSYGTIDFRFKNSRKYPVRLVATVQNGIATVSMYGIKEAEEYTVSFNTKTISTIPYSTQYEEDSSLAVGIEKVRQSGANGLVSETYITKSLNGKIVSQKLLSRDTYSAMTKIVLRGSSQNLAPVQKEVPVVEEDKKPEPTPTPTPTPDPTPTPTPKPEEQNQINTTN